jgi:hypothetical protein
LPSAPESQWLWKLCIGLLRGGFGGEAVFPVSLGKPVRRADFAAEECGGSIGILRKFLF